MHFGQRAKVYQILASATVYRQAFNTLYLLNTLAESSSSSSTSSTSRTKGQHNQKVRFERVCDAPYAQRNAGKIMPKSQGQVLEKERINEACFSLFE